MTKDNIVELKKPVAIKDLLTEVLRNGMQLLLTMVVQAEVDEFLSQHKMGNVLDKLPKSKQAEATKQLQEI